MTRGTGVGGEPPGRRAHLRSCVWIGSCVAKLGRRATGGRARCWGLRRGIVPAMIAKRVAVVSAAEIMSLATYRLILNCMAQLAGMNMMLLV